MTLETPRLVLRRFTEGDAAAFLAVVADPAVNRFIHAAPLADAGEALARLRAGPLNDYRMFGFGRHAVVLKETGEVIGYAGLKWLPEQKAVDVGYGLRSAFWGRGLATEAARAALDDGFARLGVRRVIGLVDPANAASANVLRKLGLTPVGPAVHCGHAVEMLAVEREPTLASVASGLRLRVDAAAVWLRAVADVAVKPAPAAWSKKEILGHLIDSASNNHQRFVRAALQDELTFPKYEQEGWARCQDHASADWGLLIDLWSAYNRHLAWVIERLPAGKRAMPVEIVGYEPCTLGWLVEDYVVHLDHHLGQLRR